MFFKANSTEVNDLTQRNLSPLISLPWSPSPLPSSLFILCMYRCIEGLCHVFETQKRPAAHLHMAQRFPAYAQHWYLGHWKMQHLCASAWVLHMCRCAAGFCQVLNIFVISFLGIQNILNLFLNEFNCCQWRGRSQDENVFYWMKTCYNIIVNS